MRKAKWLGLLGVLGVSVVFATCGDEEEPNSDTGGTSTSTTTTTTGGGMGGTATTGGGMGGAGGQGGQGGVVDMGINGCTDAEFMPPADPTNVVITNNLTTYTPSCLLIAPGTSVTFTMDFTLHPLRAGTIVNGVATEDPLSPIQATGPGAPPPPPSVTFTFPDAGDYPFYCNVHGTETGMMGAIRVQ